MFSDFFDNRPEIEYPNGYKVYTTKFDKAVKAQFPDEVRQRLAGKIAKLNRFVEENRIDADIKALKLIGTLRKRVEDRPFDDTVVSILLDHSGSMRDQRAMFCILAVSVLTDFLSRLDIRHEILGFTTSSWHGGRSRKRWRLRGRYKNPGRLCDLLHIVYRDASDSRLGAPCCLSMMLNDKLLKENVDGEALLWAASRLDQGIKARKIILHFSDGAPVDDSTLAINPPDILHKHMIAVVGDLSARPGYRVGGVGIDYDVKRYFPECISISSIDSIADELLPFVANLLSGET
ncbi:cobaltochelatase CobT-related protein [Oricola sp.]|uniref:cobaltochelatase CobT-related protein n=1 Tax=Oricola sp. TaxID=1979950 RepID=UPI003BABD238